MTHATINTGRLIAGLALVVVGVLFLLDQSGTVNAGSILSDWWPLIIIAVGLVQLLVNPRSYLGPTIIMLVGLLLLGSSLDVYTVNIWDLIWPAVLIVIGLSILTGRSISNRTTGIADANDWIHSASIFTGSDIVSHSENLRGADVTAIFGGATLDLENAKLAPEGAAIDVTAIFGGVKIVVPGGWNTETNGTPVFGGFNNKTRGDTVLEGAPVLVVRGIAVFGGVDIQHER